MDVSQQVAWNALVLQFVQDGVDLSLGADESDVGGGRADDGREGLGVVAMASRDDHDVGPWGDVVFR